jgi:hypothetical protein
LGLEPRAGFFRLSSWAEVLDVKLVSSEAMLDEFSARHVYQRPVLLERLHARHGRALHALTVRVHPLPEPLLLPLGAEHRGCKSWVPIDLAGAVPVRG